LLARIHDEPCSRDVAAHFSEVVISMTAFGWLSVWIFNRRRQTLA
jgi:hypothetical protein